MDRNALWKWLILICAVAFSLWVVTPPKEKIRLGLDLRGGMSFAVMVDRDALRQEILNDTPDATPEQIADQMQVVLDGAQQRSLEVMRNRVDNLGISEPVIYPGKDGRIIIQLPGVGEQKRLEAEKSIQSLAFLEFRMVHEKNDDLTDRLFAEGLSPEGYRIARIDGKPYYKRDTNYAAAAAEDGYRGELGRFQVPAADYEFLLEEREEQKQLVYRPAFVKRRRELTGQYLKNAAVDYRSFGQPVVELAFDSKGARLFANITADYAPGGAKNPNPDKSRQLAIVLDGTLYTAPSIREAIYGGKAEISGNFSLQDANFLKNVLRAGSLPAPVKIVEKRFVAPTLGEDSIRSGVHAVVYGGVAVLVFMLIYYMMCGVVANLALILNMILLPLGMIIAAGFLGIFAKDASGGGPIQLPVLTLPGIAGIVLTLGMAVDANVLIFERIREESGTGKRLWTAISAGYDRAFVTIVDANLTTLLTGIILFVFGSGPIRGFAVTLCAGIAVSMFTALVVTKLFFGVLAKHTKIQSFKMLSVVGKTTIDFVAKRKMAAVVSVALIALSWGILVTRGVRNPSTIFGVDFTGGASVTFAFKAERPEDVEVFKEQHPVDDIRAKLAAAGLDDPTIQYQTEMESGAKAFLQVKTGAAPVGDREAIDVVKDALVAGMPEAGFSVIQEDQVGPQIGKELTSRAVWSIVWALVGIIVYISWRFELGFALGAIVALTHDVFITVGLYSLFGRQLSLPIVAALLTIVGYSVNDTIVVFDRIREDLKLTSNKSFKDIANLSVNQTLSRTLLTSITTLIAVVMLLLVGGGAINDFALALLIGVIVGTYSSIFVATPVVLLYYRDKRPGFASKAV